MDGTATKKRTNRDKLRNHHATSLTILQDSKRRQVSKRLNFSIDIACIFMFMSFSEGILCLFFLVSVWDSHVCLIIHATCFTHASFVGCLLLVLRVRNLPTTE
jgi:hypothetical protein